MPALSFSADGDEGIDQFCQCGSNHRGDPEEPELSECPPSHEEREAAAASGVDGEICDRNSDQVNQCETKADRDGREARAELGCQRLPE